MAIPLPDQNSLIADPEFRARVTAASVTRAIAIFDDTANPDTAVQIKRLFLSRAILSDPTRYVDQFAWWVVTRPGLNSVTDVANDTTVINNISNTGFDSIAEIVVTNAEVGV